MKNIFKAVFISVVLSIFVFNSCNRYTMPGSRTSIEDRRTTKESHYNPLGFSDDSEVVTADVSAVDDTLREESDQLTFPEYEREDSAVNTVFSVQVFATKSSEEASDFKEEIQPGFEETVHSEYKQPYYKVRIGETYTIEEGEALLDKVKRMGFKDAWLVRINKQGTN